MYDQLINQMIEQGQYYAALAHVEEAKKQGTSPALRYLEAESQRRLKQFAKAKTLYQGLINDADWAGLAYQGLGKMALPQDLPTALNYLRLAVQAKPSEALIRNDLGFALLLNRQPALARKELATAYELGKNQTLIRHNFLICLWLLNEKAAFEQVAVGLDATTLTRLRAQADRLRKPE
jgi:Flp pilus assembly protein TadD